MRLTTEAHTFVMPIANGRSLRTPYLVCSRLAFGRWRDSVHKLCGVPSFPRGGHSGLDLAFPLDGISEYRHPILSVSGTARPAGSPLCRPTTGPVTTALANAQGLSLSLYRTPADATGMTHPATSAGPNSEPSERHTLTTPLHVYGSDWVWRVTPNNEAYPR